MNIQETIKRYLSTYEKLRKDDYVSSICDFPKCSSSLSNKEWAEVFELTKFNFQSIKKCVLSNKLSTIKINKNNFNISIINDDLLNDNKILSILWMIYFLYKIYKIGLSQKEIKIKYFADFINLKINFTNENGFYFRGVTNKNYDLVPSYYRNLQSDYIFEYFSFFKEFKNDFSNFQDMYKFQEEPRLKSSNNPLIEARESNIKYEYFFEFLTFLQHAECLTPFLDLSRNLLISNSFACHKNEGNAALYVINTKQNNEVFKIKNNDIDESFFVDFRVECLKNKIKPKAKIFNRNLWSLDSTSLTAKFKLFNPIDNTQIPINERMRYQQGCFLIPFHAIIVNNKILIDFNKTKIKKYVINKAIQNSYVKYLNDNYPTFKYRYLMNSFGYLKDKNP